MGLKLIKKTAVRHQYVLNIQPALYIRINYEAAINTAARIKYDIKRGDPVYLYYDEKEMILGIQKADEVTLDTYIVGRRGILNLKSVFLSLNLSPKNMKGKYPMVRELSTDSILRVDLTKKKDHIAIW